MNDKAGREFVLDIGSDGVIRTIYKDELKEIAEDMKGEISTVCRASNVEWEVVEKPLNARFPATKGWSVRSAHNPTLALRWESSLNAGIGDRYTDNLVCSDNEHLAIALFESRDNAIKWEIHFFADLLPPRESRSK